MSDVSIYFLNPNEAGARRGYRLPTLRALRKHYTFNAISKPTDVVNMLRLTLHSHIELVAFNDIRESLYTEYTLV